MPSDQFKESALFAEDQSRGLGHGEIGDGFLVGAEAGAVGLIGSKARKRDQAPSHIVHAVMREKGTDQLAAAAGNDAAPIFSVLFEAVTLVGIDLVADKERSGRRCASWR